MKATDFLKTRWGELARTVEGEAQVRKEFKKWLRKTKNTTLAKRARQLWDYFNSGHVSGTEKVLIVAALLYLISPVDLVPDWIPVAGLLDDAAVAGLVLDYVLSRISGGKREKRWSPATPVLKAVKKKLSRRA